MRSRSAFAIAAALCAIVMIAALMTGVFFASAQESGSTRLAIIDQQAFAAADAAASTAIASLDVGAMDVLAQGSVTTIASASSPPTETRVIAAKLDSGLFVIAAEGRVTSPDAQSVLRRVTLLVHAESADSGQFVIRRVSEQAWSEAY